MVSSRGAGAGPDFNGASGVQVHMTNTRITDAEILERRYPVLLRTFGIRRGSGGKGKYNGGEGVVREIEFLRVSIYQSQPQISTYDSFIHSFIHLPFYLVSYS